MHFESGTPPKEPIAGSELSRIFSGCALLASDNQHAQIQALGQPHLRFPAALIRLRGQQIQDKVLR
jgi:hypothetical protein